MQKELPMEYKLVVFRKPDLDTMLAAYILLGSSFPMILAVKGLAPATALDDARVLCLECGGSGTIEKSNFDHHGDMEAMPCAAEQAWQAVNCPQDLSNIVAYAAAVDSATAIAAPQTGMCTLSGVFSGMFLLHASACARFRAGLRLLAAVHHAGVSPLDVDFVVQRHPEFATYEKAKTASRMALEKAAVNTRAIRVDSYSIQALVTSEPGVHGLLRRRGAHISIAGSRMDNSMFRWTISFVPELAQFRTYLLGILNSIENGWGGPCGGTIVGSPFTGSNLSPACIIKIVRGTLEAFLEQNRA